VSRTQQKNSKRWAHDLSAKQNLEKGNHRIFDNHLWTGMGVMGIIHSFWIRALRPQKPAHFSAGLFCTGYRSICCPEVDHPRGFQRWRYYLIAWFLPLIVIIFVILLAIFFGISRPDFSLQRFFAMAFPKAVIHSVPAWIWFVIPSQALITSVIASVILFGEEFGWRGYLQFRLFSTRPLLSAVCTGIIWGIWHYPLNLRGYNYPGHRLLGLVVFPVGTVLLSIIFGWLRLRSESIWPACLAHASTNAVGGSMLMLLFYGDPNWILLSYLGVLAWIPLACLCLWIILTGQLKTPAEQAR
jgi:membrane protease YdiL (CAAX protease family)